MFPLHALKSIKIIKVFLIFDSLDFIFVYTHRTTEPQNHRGTDTWAFYIRLYNNDLPTANNLFILY